MGARMEGQTDRCMDVWMSHEWVPGQRAGWLDTLL